MSSVKTLPPAAALLPVSAPLSLRNGRLALFGLVWLAYLATSFITRVVLSAVSLHDGLVSWAMLPRAFAMGMLLDSVTGLYLCGGLAVYLWLAPRRLFASRFGRRLVFAGFVVTIAAFVYLVAAEVFFFDEFNARFNYTAVEYLIYPTEVFTNIRESYPVGRALLTAISIGLSATFLLRHRIRQAFQDDAGTLRLRTLAMLVFGVLVALSLEGLSLQNAQGANTNRISGELADNGVYSFFSALKNADIDYDRYYATLSDTDAAVRLRRLVQQSNTQFLPPSVTTHPLARQVDNSDLGPPRKLHVIVLLQESLGSEFVGSLGGRDLTPNVDRIARDGVSFTHLYASGTRTVRGMEALTTSLAPVPPEAVVKRSHNEGLFNLSTVARRAGYAPTFIYGGYGTFDNMNAFFGGNGWRVVDRVDMPKPRFSNIWGIADEELMDNALDVFDQQVAHGEKIFSVVMSTSNHKPFTFPEGIAGVQAKGGGRDAGVRYADYAIGKFYDKLKTRPWYRDTVLVVTGDHGARVYGRAQIPVPTYSVPFIVHAPAYLAPQRVDTLASQIDIGPTLLGMLHLSYESRLPGRDILRMKPEDGYAVFNHNRNIAMLRGDQIATLGFGKTVQTETYDAASGELRPAPHNPVLEQDAQAMFQMSYDLFATGRQRE
ncbi:LTA synthase family protein [Pigmentiphaga litoralis]|uniref:Phosphoglycerol transferase MdoB-like AlkP superfamily enzyme n=1 Tax=Pigmentiphaga litoralis TaxID=516702 RepID=A0A7Y9IXM7_9BURK|nr:phosphoglycerol transferase MdoB-like AlkP superfamily enzyme [Pigmentiphaga litoralis]NYE84986.1 phosphoglycerol transferase MdoB-like AlkP superfamily enzyme [Pigmentiphaga litoralis]